MFAVLLGAGAHKFQTLRSGGLSIESRDNEEPTVWHAEAFGYKCSAKPSAVGATPSERLARSNMSDSAG